MEKAAETPLKELNQLKISMMNMEQQKTPPTVDEKIGLKTKLVSLSGGTPERLKLPKAFKHPERYMSPTDRMISPVSKGLILARSRRPGSLLPPSMNQPSKIKELQSEDVEKAQQKNGDVPGLSSESVPGECNLHPRTNQSCII